MPSAGLQIFGSGLQLQPVTPGVTDQGNANISGTFIARTGIWHLNGAENLGMFGRNPGVNQALNWGNAVEPNCIFGYNNTIVDGNVLQNNVFVGSNNSIGNAAHVGVTSFLVVGSENTLYTGGDNGNILSAIVLGHNNRCNKTPATTSNEGPIIIGYNNNWNNINNNTAYDPGVIIGKNINISGGSTFNTTIVGPLNSDAPPGGGNAIKIGNSLQSDAQVGPYRIQNLVGWKYLSTLNVTVANTAAETTLLSDGVGSLSLPAGLLKIGSTIRVMARGVIADTGTPTVRFRVKLNGTAFLDFGAVTFPTLVGTHGWEIRGEITIRSAGPAGNAIGNGIAIVSVSGMPDIDTVNTAVTNIDTSSAPVVVDMTVQWGTAAPGNTITQTNATVEVLG